MENDCLRSSIAKRDPRVIAPDVLNHDGQHRRRSIPRGGRLRSAGDESSFPVELFQWLPGRAHRPACEALSREDEAPTRA